MDYDDITGGAASGDPLEFARTLAAALAEYSASASVRGGAQPLPPAEKQRRDAAHAEMLELLAKLEETGATPRYLITTAAPGGFFIDDVLIEGGQEIEFLGIPNPEMEPKNAPARKVHSLYMESIGGLTDLGDQAYDAYLNRPRHASIVGARNEAPPLGTPRSVSRARLVDPAQPDLPEIKRERDPITGRYKPMPEQMA